MLRQVLSAALLVIAFACFSACQRVDVEVQPVTLSGEWRLTAAGGGITGQMGTTSPSHDFRLVFGPDSSYAKYYNGKLLEANIYHLRQEPSHAGGPQVQVVLFKTINTPNGQSIYARYYVTTLSVTSLETTTGGGCAISQVYERVKKETSANTVK